MRAALGFLFLLTLCATSAYGFSTNEWEEVLSKNNNETSISRNLQLVFFFSSTCRYCHQLAPHLLEAASESRISVHAVSADGQGIPGFEHFNVDPKLQSMFGVQSYPSVFLLNLESKDAYPIAIGYVDKSTLSLRVQESISFVNKKASHV